MSCCRDLITAIANDPERRAEILADVDNAELRRKLTAYAEAAARTVSLAKASLCPLYG